MGIEEATAHYIHPSPVPLSTKVKITTHTFPILHTPCTQHNLKPSQTSSPRK